MFFLCASPVHPWGILPPHGGVTEPLLGFDSIGLAAIQMRSQLPRQRLPAIAPQLQNDCAANLTVPILPARSAGGGGPDAIMLMHVLTSKLHRARVTAGNVVYEGSLGIPRNLLDKVGRLPCKRIL